MTEPPADDNELIGPPGSFLEILQRERKMPSGGPPADIKALVARWADLIAIDLRTGELVVTTQEQRDLMTTAPYREEVRRLMNIALRPKQHAFIRNIGRAV